jgi:hypothetical protein
MNGKPPISHRERLAHLGVSLFYGRLVSDYGEFSSEATRADGSTRQARCLRRWRHLRGPPDFEIREVLCPASALGRQGPA